MLGRAALCTTAKLAVDDGFGSFATGAIHARFARCPKFSESRRSLRPNDRPNQAVAHPSLSMTIERTGLCTVPTPDSARAEFSSRSVLLFQQGLAEKGDDLIHRASCRLARRIYQVAGKDGMRRLSLRLHAGGVSFRHCRAVPCRRTRRRRRCAGSVNAMPGR